MSRLRPMINRIVDRNVEEAEIKKQIEDLKRQRSEILENLVGETRRILGVSNEEPEAANDDDDDYGDDYGDDDDWYGEQEEEWDE